MKVSLWIAPAVSVAVLFGSVGVATITGDWITGGREQVVQGVAFTADDIKGWMTLQQAADGLGIPAATIIALIAPADPGSLSPSTTFKEVEAIVPGFALTALREQLRTLQPGPPIASPTR
jgi:hypothetical protein